MLQGCRQDRTSQHSVKMDSQVFLKRRGSHPKANLWSMNQHLHKNPVRMDLSYLFNLNSWMMWSPVWLPMIFVITPPLSEFCNFRTGIFLMLLLFIRWNRAHLEQWSHMLKNAKWTTFLFTIFVPRLWPTRIERHCNQCESVLAAQVRVQDQEYQTTSSVQTVGWKLRSLRRFPWRIFSRHWGILAHTKLRPHFLNTIVIYIYVWIFDCKVQEAEVENLSKYSSLGSFFTRKLKPEVRPVDPSSAIVSPADGTTTFCGPFSGGFLQQVKNVHYSLPYFLGLQTKGQLLHGAMQNPCDLLVHKSEQNTKLYQSVIYLSPGDYHRFHSPVQWTIHTRRHFPGELLSVKPSVVSSIPGLFHLNERVSWIGNWKYGFFSMTAVGATNVGSIHFENGKVLDPELRTNRPYGRKSRCDMATPCSTRNFYFSEKHFENRLQMEKGQPFGHFAFGSTIVLIFEAPHDFEFNKMTNDRVWVGKSL